MSICIARQAAFLGNLDEITVIIGDTTHEFSKEEDHCTCEAAPVELPKCSMCRRERTLGDPKYPMDAYDYTPMQVITGQRLGWYTGDDGEVCPECMEKTVR